MMTMRVLLADDHQIVRQGVRALLNQDGRFQVVGEADDGPTVVRLASEVLPDVVVMDLGLPKLSGIEATRQIMASHHGLKVIGLTGNLDPATGTAMLRAGAMGYVLKDAAVDVLISAIEATLRGEIYVSPRLMNAVMADMVGSVAGGQPRPTALSYREKEVLQLVAEGRSMKQAAQDLSVSVKTIESHRRNLMEKLQIDNVAGLTKYAIREGLCGL